MKGNNVCKFAGYHSWRKVKGTRGSNVKGVYGVSNGIDLFTDIQERVFV